MDKINILINDLDNNNISLENKIKLINNLNKLIEKEKKNLSKLQNDIQNDNFNQKFSKKYNSKSIDELNIIFNDTDEISDKTIIYKILCNKINNELDNIIFSEADINSDSMTDSE